MNSDGLFDAVGVPDPDVDALINANWDMEDVAGMEVRVAELSTAQSVVSARVQALRAQCAIETDIQSRLTMRGIGIRAALKIGGPSSPWEVAKLQVTTLRQVANPATIDLRVWKTHRASDDFRSALQVFQVSTMALSDLLDAQVAHCEDALNSVSSALQGKLHTREQEQAASEKSLQDLRARVQDLRNRSLRKRALDKPAGRPASAKTKRARVMQVTAANDKIASRQRREAKIQAKKQDEIEFKAWEREIVNKANAEDAGSPPKIADEGSAGAGAPTSDAVSRDMVAVADGVAAVAGTPNTNAELIAALAAAVQSLSDSKVHAGATKNPEERPASEQSILHAAGSVSTHVGLPTLAEVAPPDMKTFAAIHNRDVDSIVRNLPKLHFGASDVREWVQIMERNMMLAPCLYWHWYQFMVRGGQLDNTIHAGLHSAFGQSVHEVRWQNARKYFIYTVGAADTQDLRISRADRTVPIQHGDSFADFYSRAVMAISSFGFDSSNDFFILDRFKRWLSGNSALSKKYSQWLSEVPVADRTWEVVCNVIVPKLLHVDLDFQESKHRSERNPDHNAGARRQQTSVQPHHNQRYERDRATHRQPHVQVNTVDLSGLRNQPDVPGARPCPFCKIYVPKVPGATDRNLGGPNCLHEMSKCVFIDHPAFAAVNAERKVWVRNRSSTPYPRDNRQRDDRSSRH